VAEIAADSAFAANEKALEIHLEPPRAKVDIDGDRRLLHSALANLVNNAVKFSRARSAIHIGWRDGGDALAIDIDDSCGGLPAGATEKIFAPFVQVGDDRSGYGLGLAIARQAIEAHGGAIRVRNRPGDGCTFTIELPKTIVSR
jgi:signal transduction histidine kinase